MFQIERGMGAPCVQFLIHMNGLMAKGKRGLERSEIVAATQQQKEIAHVVRDIFRYIVGVPLRTARGSLCAPLLRENCWLQLWN